MDRAALIELSKRKPIPPFTLGESLTLYCPEENLGAFDNAALSEFHRWLRTFACNPPIHYAGSAVLLLRPNKKYILCGESLATNRVVDHNRQVYTLMRAYQGGQS
jgi:hypothetical protein